MCYLLAIYGLDFFDPLVPHIKDFFVWLYSMGPITIVPIILIGIYFGLKKYMKETIILLIWVLVPVIVQSEFAKAFTARYIYFTLPYLLFWLE